MLIIFCFCTCFTLAFISHSQNGLKEFIDIYAEGVRGVASTVLEQTSNQYKKRIKSFLNYHVAPSRSGMIKAFADQNQKELLRLTAPFYDLLKKEDPSFSTLTWILSSNTSFLHLHDPQKAGTDISQWRPDIVSANKEHRQYTGFSVSPVGLQYRIVNPVRYEDKYIGVLHFGLQDSLFIDAIHEKLQVPVGLVIPREEFQRINLSKLPGITGDSYGILSRQIDLFKDNFAAIDWAQERQQIVLQGKDYIILKVVALTSSTDDLQGHIFVALDLSKQVGAVRSHIKFIISLSAILMLLSFLVLYFSFGSLVQKLTNLQVIEKVNKELEDRVKERTCELETNKNSLKQSEQKFRSLVEDINDWVWEIDENGVYIYASPTVEKLLGYRPDEVVGKTPYYFMSELEAKRVGVIFGQNIERRASFRSIINTNLHKNGHEVVLETSGQAVIDEDGMFKGYRGVDRDITEKQQAADERQQLAHQLNQAQKMESIGRLAGGVAHDFNNILSAINGYAEICLMRMEDDQPLRPEIEIILESGQRAARLTQQLLAFSRKQVIRQEQLDLNREVDEINKMLGRLLGEDIEIEITQAENLWPVKADRSQLEQVVLNLAINARDAMPAGGKLTIETINVSLGTEYIQSHYNITPGDYVLLAISDNGTGMNEEIREHIFEPFFTTKTKGKGTGLGLATVYGIIKQNKGEIQLYSEPGLGTTFKVYLPRAEEAIEEKKSAQVEADQTDLRGTETIMLVEDDEMVRKMSVEILTGFGYTVLEANNGEDALQITSRFHGTIDLLLTDVIMPKMGGTELAAKIQELFPKIKVLFMSGYTENAIVKHGVLEDGVNFIHKPITPKVLSQVVRKVLG